jgi:hypothetical protein
MDISQEINHANAILIKDLERAAKYAAVADRFSNLSSDVQLPNSSIEIAFGFLSVNNPDERFNSLGAEIRDEFASYSARFSILTMITAFEIFVVRVLWIAKVCQWALQNGVQIPTAEFYRLGQEARENARHKSVHRTVSLIGEHIGKCAEFKSLEWFRSIYAARNCLTHRGGLVGPEDVNDGEKLKLVYRVPQLIVDGVPQEKKRGLYVEGGATVGITFVNEEREIAIGESLILTPQDCQNIALSIAACANDILKMINDAAQEIFQKHNDSTVSS